MSMREHGRVGGSFELTWGGREARGLDEVPVLMAVEGSIDGTVWRRPRTSALKLAQAFSSLMPHEGGHDAFRSLAVDARLSPWQPWQAGDEVSLGPVRDEARRGEAESGTQPVVIRLEGASDDVSVWLGRPGVADGRVVTPPAPSPVKLPFSQVHVETAVQVGWDTDSPWVLAGHGVASSDALSPKLYGTDLGYAVNHDGKTWLFFGDTWTWDGQNAPQNVTTSEGGDDAVAWTKDVPGPASTACPKLTFVTKEGAFAPLSFSPTLPLGYLRTPAGAFSTGKNLFVIVITDPPLPGEVGSSPDHVFGVYIGKQRTQPSRFVRVGASLAAGHPEQVFFDQSSQRWFSAFSVVAYAVPPRFLSNSVSYPHQPSEEGVLDIKRPVFVWGRASFVKAPGSGALVDVYLMVLDADELDAPAVDPEKNLRRYYFTGLDQRGLPTWGVGPGVKPKPIILGESEVTYTNQMTVSYDKHLRLWVMLYGGGLDSAPSAPAVRAVYARLAPQPWGPWSEPNLVFDPSVDAPQTGGYEVCQTLFIPGVVGAKCVKTDDLSPIGMKYENILGFPYGAGLWPEAQYAYKSADGAYRGSTFYFVMSTFNPYRVVMMRASIGVKLGDLCAPCCLQNQGVGCRLLGSYADAGRVRRRWSTAHHANPFDHGG